MAFERFQESARLTRDAFYSAFSSPSYGITWSAVAFFSGLFYLVYKERRRRNLTADPEEIVTELEGSAEEL
jgi:hypothetical protein